MRNCCAPQRTPHRPSTQGSPCSIDGLPGLSGLKSIKLQWATSVHLRPASLRSIPLSIQFPDVTLESLYYAGNLYRLCDALLPCMSAEGQTLVAHLREELCI